MASFRSIIIGDKVRYWRTATNYILQALGLIGEDETGTYIATTATANKLVKTLGTGKIDPSFNSVASQAEVTAGAEATKAVTPATLAGLGNSKTANGYVKLPGGVIIQWGEEASFHDIGTDYDATLTFPIAFPTACLQVLAGLRGDGVSTSKASDCTISVTSKSATQVGIHIDDLPAGVVQSCKATYIAIGH